MALSINHRWSLLKDLGNRRSRTKRKRAKRGFYTRNHEDDNHHDDDDDDGDDNAKVNKDRRLHNGQHDFPFNPG